MEKLIVEMSIINKNLKAKFGLVLDIPENIKSKSNNTNETISSFNIDGNTYLKFSPKPQISLEIINYGKDKGYTANSMVSFNQKNMFIFGMKLKAFIENFKDNIFYYQNDVLKVNSDVIKKDLQKYTLDMISSNKHIRMFPVVVTGDRPEEVYEGCVMYINTVDNFVYITYTELLFLYHIMTTTNLNQMSIMALMMYGYIKEHTEEKKIETKPVIEEKEKELTNTYVELIPPSTIPNL